MGAASVRRLNHLDSSIQSTYETWRTIYFATVEQKMSNRLVHFHELGDQEWVSIAVKGEITLDILESIESFCHRQRVRLCQQMQEQLAKPHDLGAQQAEKP